VPVILWKYSSLPHTSSRRGAHLSTTPTSPLLRWQQIVEICNSVWYSETAHGAWLIAM
jgi:hypothetical protein